MWCAVPSLDEKASVDPKPALRKEQGFAAGKDAATLARQNVALIAEFRQLLVKAKQLRGQRDGLNARVIVLRDKKNELLGKLKTLAGSLREARAKAGVEKEAAAPRLKEKGPSLNQLAAEFERLEWEQQTEALSIKESKALEKRLRELRKQMPAASKGVKASAQVRQLSKELRPVKEELDKARAEFDAARKESDARHEEAMALSKKADELGKKIGENIKILGEKREAEGEERRKYGERLKQVMTAEEREEKARLQKKRREHDKRLDEFKLKAQKVREKLKAGGKLSMEEFQILQQAEE